MTSNAEHTADNVRHSLEYESFSCISSARDEVSSSTCVVSAGEPAVPVDLEPMIGSCFERFEVCFSVLRRSFGRDVDGFSTCTRRGTFESGRLSWISSNGLWSWSTFGLWSWWKLSSLVECLWLMIVVMDEGMKIFRQQLQLVERKFRKFFPSTIRRRLKRTAFRFRSFWTSTTADPQQRLHWMTLLVTLHRLIFIHRQKKNVHAVLH